MFIYYILLNIFLLPNKALEARHPIKMSVCEVIYRADQANFEIKCYLYQDDLRETLYGRPDAGDLDQATVSSYILKQVSMSVNDQQKNLAFQSLRFKNEQVLVTFVSDKISGAVSKVTLNNRLLIDKFSSQTNVVYLYYPDENAKKTKMLNINTTQALFYL